MRSITRKLLALAVLLLPSLVHASGAITLTATTDTLELGTTTTATTDYTCSFVDNTATTFTPGSSSGQITTITETVIVSAPAASTQRKISGCSIHVVSGGTQTVTVQWDQSGTERIKFVAVLTTGWSLQWNEEGRFEVYDDTGNALSGGIVRDGTGDTTQANVSGGRLHVDGSGVTQPISAASLPLPTGASTSALQDGIVKDGAGDTTQANVTSGRLNVDGSGVTQPVSGTVTATATDLDIRNLNATDDIVQARGAAADGAAVTGNPVLVAGQDGTNTQTIKTDTTGSVQVDIESAPTITVTATDLDVRIGASDTVTVAATDLDIRNLNATDDIVQARGAAADGAAVTGNPVLIAGQDGTNAQSVKTDSSGSIQVDIESITAGDTDIGNVDVEFAGTAASTNNGAADATTMRVTVANDSTGEIRVADDAGNQIPSSTATMALNSRGLNVRVVSADPCGNEKVTPFNVNLASATTTLVATGVASEHVYICSVNVVVGAAQGLAFIAGTGATCGTSSAGMNGGTTGATGWQFAANGGIALPNTGFAHMSTEISGGATGDSVCIVTSTAAQTSGTISYVIQVP